MVEISDEIYEIGKRKGYLSVKDIVRGTTLSESSIRSLIYSGELPAKKDDGIWKISVEDLKNLTPKDHRKRKLSDEDVRFIRENRGKILQEDLAKMFGVSTSHISYIQLRKRRPNVG